MKKIFFEKIKPIAILLVLLLAFSLFTACGQPEENGGENPAEEVAAADFSIGALKGPTSMGLAKLINDADPAKAESDAKPISLSNNYTYTLAGSPDELTPAFVKGDLDIICVPANLAAVLCQKMEGNVKVLGINTLGVIYIVDTDGSISAVDDLRGKTVVAAGQGSTPEYALRFILSENGIDPDKDVNIQWKSEHAECVSALASGQASVAMLPQPFVTVAQNKIEGLNASLDLTKEWDKLGVDSSLITGVTIVRGDVAQGFGPQLENFMKDYAASVDYVNANPAEAAAIIGDLGIVDAAVAEKAIPYCNIVCITGNEMKEKLSGYLKVLFDANPASVGGALPDENFYF